MANQTALIETETFNIACNGKTWDVRVETVGGETIYLVKYPGGAVYLALVRASGLNDPKFWATIPENSKRHDEAQELGELIFRHFNPLQ